MKINLTKEGYKTPKTFYLDTLFRMMRSENQRKAIEAYQRLFPLYEKGKIPESKKPPLVTFNGPVFNGIILIEINNPAGKSKINRLRELAAQAPQTLAAFTGSGGKSLKVLVRFVLPDGTLPTGEENIRLFYAHAHRRAVLFYRMLLDKEITPGEPAFDKGCRLSWDPELYYHPAALLILMEQPLEMPTEVNWQQKKELAGNPVGRMMPGAERDNELILRFETAMQKTLDHWDEETRPFEDTPKFINRLSQNCQACGVPEEETVKRVRLYSGWDGDERQIRLMIRNIYRINNREKGKSPLCAVQQMAWQLESFMERRYDLRRNMLTREVEYREQAALFSRFQAITEEALNTFSLQAHGEGLDFWDRDIRRYVFSTRIPPYHPIGHYLESLPPRDGKDHIGMLAERVPTGHVYWKNGFRRWFLGMVAQWKGLNRTHGHSLMPVLVGPQACGKSSWCRNLLPHELREYYTDSLDYSQKSRAEQALNRFALINLDEFDSIPANKQPFLKHLVQKPEVNLRRPHKANYQSLPRHASFIATCNNFDLLTDPTGSRRYLCVDIHGEIDYLTPIPYKQLYAQAIAALKQGERYWFDREEEQQLTFHNKAFEQMIPEEQLLLRYSDPALPEEDSGEWLSAMEILLRIQKKGALKSSQTTLIHFGRILRKHSYPWKHSKKGNVFKIKWQEAIG